MKNSTTNFEQLNVIEPITKELAQNGITSPTQIQFDSIPKILERQNILIKAMTGTGKTAAFAIPIVQNLALKNNFLENKRPKVIVVSPNRELSSQISDSFKMISKFLKLRILTIIGGVRQSFQVERLRNGVDVVIVTPGRCKDLLLQKKLNLSSIEYFVLDEVDLMLDMGFIEDIQFIKKAANQNAQVIFVSATIPSKIKNLAKEMLNEYSFVEVKNDGNEDLIDEKLHYINFLDKKHFVLDFIKKNSDESIIIFANMKRKVDELESFLRTNKVKATTLHSDRSQQQRQFALKDFKSKRHNILIATDIAARGIHVDNVNYVIHFDVPNNPDNYLHRKGRTGRAGSKGTSILLVDKREILELDRIIRIVTPNLIVDANHEWHVDLTDPINFARSKDKKTGNVFERRNRRSSSQDRGNRWKRDFKSSHGNENKSSADEIWKERAGERSSNNRGNGQRSNYNSQRGDSRYDNDKNNTRSSSRWGGEKSGNRDSSRRGDDKKPFSSNGKRNFGPQKSNSGFKSGERSSGYTPKVKTDGKDNRTKKFETKKSFSGAKKTPSSNKKWK